MRKKVSYGLAVLGVVGLFFFALNGFLLDQYRLAPFYGFRSEGAKPILRERAISDERVSFDRITYAIESGGAGGSGVEVCFFRTNSRVLAVGGNESTFVGIRNVDSDEDLEILVTSTSRWPKKGVWKFVNGQYIQVLPTREAAVVLFVARLGAHGFLGALISVLLIAWGLADVRGILRREREIPVNRS